MKKIEMKSLTVCWMLFCALIILGTPIIAVGGSISGTVRDSTGTAITGSEINVDVYSGDPCGDYQHIQGVSTNPSDGSYIVMGLPPGDYLLRAKSWETNHIREWWASPASVFDCNSAQSVTVGVSSDHPGKDFQLDLGGSISGTVYQNDGIIPITEDWIGVIAYSGDPCGGYYEVDQKSSDPTDGTYTIRGLPPGTYFLHVHNNGMNYVEEWWASGESTYNCDGAESISISSPGDEVAGKDFQLDDGATISGTVYQSDGVTPITGFEISVDAMTGDPCGEHHSSSVANTNSSDGTYTILGLPPGTYYLRTDPMNEGNWISEWWTEGGGNPLIDQSSPDCNLAQFITVLAGDVINDKNFWLDLGGSISGTVTDSGGPIVGLWMHVFAGKCHDTWLGGAHTDESGDYTIYGLPVGTTYIQACASCNQFNYIDEWWDGEVGNGTTDCNLASEVNIIEDQNTLNIDFQLDIGGSISGTVTHNSVPVANANVQVWGSNWDGYGGVQTDSNGIYTLSGLPTGSYYVAANGQVYVDDNWEWPYQQEYYNNSPDQDGAELVPVTIGVETEDIDFTLEDGATIKGTVTNQNTGSPIDRAQVIVYDSDWQWISDARTNSDGSYTLGGFSDGSYYVETSGWGDFPGGWQRLYAGEYYNESPGQSGATLFEVIGEITGINFTLDEDSDSDGMADDWEAANGVDDPNDDPDGDGLNNLEEYQNNTDPNDFDSDNDGVNDGDEVNNGTNPNEDSFFTPPGTGAISGTVRDENGDPIIGVQIEIKAISGDPCGDWGEQVSVVSNSTEGTYGIAGLAPGFYYLTTNNINQSNYVSEWWASSNSVLWCNGAELVEVIEGVMFAGVDFQLDMGGSVSGTVTRQDNGSPISNAQLTLWDEDWHNGYGFQSDSDGNFIIRGYPQGLYHVEADGQVYVDDNWGVALSA